MSEDLQRAIKKVDAYALRCKGYTYAEIGNSLGCHKSTAWQWVKEAQQDALAEAENNRDVLLSEAIDTLNHQIKLAYSDLENVIDILGDDGRLYRDGVKMRSLIRQEILKYLQEKAKLLGLYTLQTLEATVTVEDSAMQ